jgi:hypothetical protein
MVTIGMGKQVQSTGYDKSKEECGDTDELEQVQDYIDSLDHHIADTSINE